MKKNIKLSLFLALAVCLSAYVPFSSTLCKLAAAAESSSLPYSFSLYWVKAQDSMSGKRGVQDGVGEQTAALALVCLLYTSCGRNIPGSATGPFPRGNHEKEQSQSTFLAHDLSAHNPRAAFGSSFPAA